MGHAQVLGLAAGVTAQHVRVAEQSGRRMTHRDLGLLVIRVGVVAEGEKRLFAEPASAAGNGEGNDNAVALLQPGDPSCRPPRRFPSVHAR